jgi:hypothetical protein
VFAVVMLAAVVAFETVRWSGRRNPRPESPDDPAYALALASPSPVTPDRASRLLSDRTKVPHQKVGK